jgi:hypothetical protein
MCLRFQGRLSSETQSKKPRIRLHTQNKGDVLHPQSKKDLDFGLRPQTKGALNDTKTVLLNA